jgi:hypothetical protein
MQKLILISHKRYDRAEDLMPYVEEVARSGMKAVHGPISMGGLR